MAEFVKLSLVLQAAEMLDQPQKHFFGSSLALRSRRAAPAPSEDGDSVPDISALPRLSRPRSPFAYDDDVSDETSSVDPEDQPAKRARLASNRMLNARNSDTHNSVEKRRRAYLSSCYENLKDSVPMMTNTRASNVKVLRGAAAYIKVNKQISRFLC